jgi:transposase InsO family protein
VSDNGTQFTSEKVIQLCEEKGIRNTNVSVEHPQANGQAEATNKVILRAIKKKLERKDKNWSEPLPAILWAYHTTLHSSTEEAPFKMVYGADAMIPVEINPPSWKREATTEEANSAALQENLDLLEEIREATHFREFAIKQRASRKYCWCFVCWHHFAKTNIQARCLI